MNNQNLIYDVSKVLNGPEPVTLEEMKDFMRLEGFVDTDESTTDYLSEFDYDDVLINSLITAAREKAESFTGCSFANNTVTVVFSNGTGEFELPYGPIQDFTALYYKDGSTVGESAIELFGTKFQYLELPEGEKLKAVYDAGFESCPYEVRLAIMQMVYHWYENRNEGGVPETALTTLRPFKRPWTWLA